MEFIWHDGGRAACGFVGLAQDCVTRSIAIASGEVYRDVYEALGQSAGRTARNGVATTAIQAFLSERGWHKGAPQAAEDLPKGAVIVEFEPIGRKRTGHLSCVIDHTIYDTWNPFEDDNFVVVSVWTRPEAVANTHRQHGTETGPRRPRQGAGGERARLTQYEYERILKRVHALHRTASNHASTEGEVRNALRAMQSLMLEHNLSRSVIVEEEDIRSMGMTRRACPLNESKASQWELSLARYITEEVFPTVQYYKSRVAHRTLVWFYGPVDDVRQTLGIFQEMLLTIATAAHVKYGSHKRGSGASYAEGYVRGLPRREPPPTAIDAKAATSVPSSSFECLETATKEISAANQHALMQARMLAIHSAAKGWLAVECGIRLTMTSRYSRSLFDAAAHQSGRSDGAKHEAARSETRKQIGIQRYLTRHEG